MTQCDHIAQRLAVGDPLNEEQRAHADLCSACGATLEATSTLQSIGRARAVVEPGPGFSSRMANRAAERIGQRRRGRIAGFAVATTGAVAMAALVLTLWTGRVPGAQVESAATQPAAQPLIDPEDELLAAEREEDTARELIWLTDADRALDQSANWEFIEKPVAPYALLLDDQAVEENP